MKKNNIIKAAATLCIMHCALCITSCSQEEEASNLIPMTLTATVGQPTRSPINNSWDGTEEIAVSTTQAGETEASVKKYTIDTNGNMTLSSEETEPFYFKSTTETKVVEAWYLPTYSTTDPTTETWTVQTDQSSDENYAKSDYLFASATVTSNATLKFDHMTAKITIKVTDKTQAGISTIKVYGGITPHNGGTTDGITTYNALLAPTTLSSGTPLFSITTTDGNIYAYTLSSALSMYENKEYIYNITISYNGIELTSCTIGEWDDNEDETKHNTDFTVDEQTKTNAAVGDYYMSDGSIVSGSETLTEDQKEACIGIVFAVGQNVYDKSIYTSPSTVHGYVIALENAYDGTCAWGPYGFNDDYILGNYYSYIDNSDGNYYNEYVREWSGYKYTANMASKARDWTTEPSNIKNNANYPAAYYATHYSVPAPKGTSGWFLPALGQHYTALCNETVRENIVNAGGYILPDTYKTSNYWSSSENPDSPRNKAYVIHYSNTNALYYIYKNKDGETFGALVRAILVF